MRTIQKYYQVSRYFVVAVTFAVVLVQPKVLLPLCVAYVLFAVWHLLRVSAGPRGGQSATDSMTSPNLLETRTPVGSSGVVELDAEPAELHRQFVSLMSRNVNLP